MVSVKSSCQMSEMAEKNRMKHKFTTSRRKEEIIKSKKVNAVLITSSLRILGCQPSLK